MEKSARGTEGTTTAAKEASGKRDESRDMECWDDDRKSKGRELVEVCKRRSLDILCVQETKWGGNSSRQLGDRYRIIYSGVSNNKNGVGIILSPHLSEQVVQVDRHSDRLMKVKLNSVGQMINIISAYAPQVGEKEVNKEELTKDLECMIDSIPVGEKVIIGADLNAHLGEGGEGYRRIHGGEGYGKRNAEGQNALESLEGLDMAVVNTFFKKREKQKIPSKVTGAKVKYIL
ncbi:endonuclease-reverse transcriptase HmRTE-e01 [Elysia marginata]|uniref:Endonuclease-reverse transcriptase HmRTE-e01 n=1 Tax=Elysia marginata TaxID=1093978 RepID=A0AAV4K2F7_9GAST|nr:endonuclease-reverse transcriptase HmRTE-e01 [Elysia marginata]